MRFTSPLNRLHIDYYFKRHWFFQKNKKIIDSGVAQALQCKGIEVTDAKDAVTEPPPPKYNLQINWLKPRPIPLDKSHPEYKEKACFEHTDNSVLIEGFKQAKVFTNSVEVKNGLPETIDELKCADSNLDAAVKESALNWTLLDAYQEKLPKLKHPDRPMYNFPRVFGVADHRRNRLATQRLLELCASQNQKLPGLLIQHSLVQTFVNQGEHLVKLDANPGAILSCRKPLVPFANLSTVESAADLELPDIYPFEPTVYLKTNHFFNDAEVYPVSMSCPYSHIHTAVVHFNETKVVNRTQEPIVDDQILGRTLMHAYTLAVAAAKTRYGKNLKENSSLPEPITIQTVQTDSRRFHFLILQLNSVGSKGPRNIVWSSPLMNMFSTCTYNLGVPSITDYNPEVFSTFMAFYRNSIGNEMCS